MRALRTRTICSRSPRRSEEHTSELQSRLHLVCRLLLEKKKKQYKHNTTHNKARHRYRPTRILNPNNATFHPPLPAPSVHHHTSAHHALHVIVRTQLTLP